MLTFQELANYMYWLERCTDTPRSFGDKDHWNWHQWISLGLWNSLD
jgi:hypothetical protein